MFDSEVGALECSDGRCVPDPCPDGDLGCECRPNFACDAGLDCVNGFCLDQSQGQCIQPYNDCYDNDAGSLGDCCDGTLLTKGGNMLIKHLIGSMQSQYVSWIG